MLVNEPESARRPRRVRSLDVVRGFAVLLMIFVDDAGSAYAVLDHSPWDGLTIADVVMPFFIFMVGVSAALALGGGKRTLAPVLRRGATLWVVGVAVQGGGLPDPTTYAWGYDLGTVRWCGILQRIAACYVVASALVLCSPRARRGGGLATADDGAFFGALALLVAAYLAMTYLTPVPTYRVGGSDVACGGIRGALGPRCSAAGFFDRALFGRAHLYADGAYARLPACSSCAPAKCPKASAPAWCAEPGVADPEGFLSGVLAVATAVIGALFARCLERCRAPRPGRDGDDRGGGYARLVDGDGDRRGALMLHWALASLALAAAALVAVAAGSPVNKQLWTPSYCLATAALCGFALTAAVALLGDLADGGDDAKFRAARALAEPLRRAGRNALLLFVLGASGVLDMCLGAVYVTSGDGRRRNVVDVARDDLFRAHVSGGGTRSNPHARADLLFAVAVAAFWAAVAWVLDARKIYWTA